jgi:hypothetical protein
MGKTGCLNKTWFEVALKLKLVRTMPPSANPEIETVFLFWNEEGEKDGKNRRFGERYLGFAGRYRSGPPLDNC